ncbi:hypothetical protein [Meridianimarinicoccus aquatilis]|uniref:AraC family transcriptional regulator n=1 Tax=Meridianimarinicoccus aquatilis TaxID=2552766 RepID=A0A4R6AR39_9RHOB|nr:hypothetical protein [Fluviibacterium aquatile]TDL86357.1 hypothetical protein E2L05_13465 [Fluviibacterium aquatile]
MFDSQTHDQTQRPPKAVPVSLLAREAKWAIDTPRSYLVPVLLWFTCGQGRLSVNGEMRGYTAHNAIFLPANTPHSCEACGRTQGTALFLGARGDLPVPNTMMHLRLTALHQQTELNELIEGFRRDCATGGPLGDEILYHRAALIALWLTRHEMHLSGSSTSDVSRTLPGSINGIRRSAEQTL